MMSPDAIPSNRWGPTPRWERRYREVLGVVATAFAEKGYLGASIKDIADRLGVRQASLYYYFPSKEAALAAICELGVKDFIGNLREILSQEAPIADKIRAAVANHLMPLRSQPDADYIRVFIRHRHELPDGLRQNISALAREYQSLIEQLFVEGIASGELQGDLNPQRATLALLGLCNSVISARALPQTSSIDDFIEDYSRIFTHGVVAPMSDAKNTAAR
jgi:AcrR family transcriptional regulator